MSKKKIVLIYTLLSVILMASCKTTEWGVKSSDISGMIYDFSNRPVPHCNVSMGWRYKTTTDINGRFVLSKVSFGTYNITGYKEGFETYTEKIVIHGPGEIIYMRIPSQSQLLNIVDEALTVNNLNLAEEIAERAYKINKNSTEMLFYYATIKFRQREYEMAIAYLEIAKYLGSRDQYTEKFLSLLKEKAKNADQTK